MLKTVFKRLLLLVLTLLLVTALAFFAFSIIPGDPTDTILGLEATDAQIAAQLDAKRTADAQVVLQKDATVMKKL